MAANTIRDIVDYTLKFKEQPLNEDAVKQAKKLVLDTLGVSISGWKEPSIAKIYRAIDRGDSTWTAQAFGTGAPAAGMGDHLQWGAGESAGLYGRLL